MLHSIPCVLGLFCVTIINHIDGFLAKGGNERGQLMPLFRFKSVLCSLLRLFILGTTLCGAALAENPISLNEIGIRYYAMEGELCLTRDQLPEDALQLLGVDARTMLGSMERDNLFLVCLSPDGRQVSLRRSDKPAIITKQNSFQLEELEKEQFLALLARLGHYRSAVWQDSAPGFALFSTFDTAANSEPDDESTLSHTVALSTLYLDKVYSFQTDIIGRTPTKADADLLLSTAKRTLLLGAAENIPTLSEPAPLTLPATVPLTDEAAAFAEEISSIPLSLSPVPSVIPTTNLTLSGKTAPDTYVRYSVNGVASSRFKANADGTFSVTMPKLTPDGTNTIEVTAFDQTHVSTIRFEVAVHWQTTPLALSQTSGEVEGESFTLYGLTLPGAKVELIRRSETVTIPVQSDGSFSVSVFTKKLGDNAFTIRSTSLGYRRADVEVMVTRKASLDEELAALRRRVKSVSYDKLVQKPATYKGRVVEWSGVVTSLENENQQPCFLLELAPNQSVLCLCADLLHIELGQKVTLLGILLGSTMPLNTRLENETYPALELITVVP